MKQLNDKELEKVVGGAYIVDTIKDVFGSVSEKRGVFQLPSGMRITKSAIGRSLDQRSDVEVFYVEFADQPLRDGWYESGKWGNVLARRSEAYLMLRNVQSAS